HWVLPGHAERQNAAMHDWPPAPSAEIPSSQLVAAWAKLNMLPAEQLPLRAAHWLTAANDGPVLRELAALSAKDDPPDIRELRRARVRGARPRCGFAPPASPPPAARVAFPTLARLHAEGHATERWVLAKPGRSSTAPATTAA